MYREPSGSRSVARSGLFQLGKRKQIRGMFQNNESNRRENNCSASTLCILFLVICPEPQSPTRAQSILQGSHQEPAKAGKFSPFGYYWPAAYPITTSSITRVPGGQIICLKGLWLPCTLLQEWGPGGHLTQGAPNIDRDPTLPTRSTFISRCTNAHLRSITGTRNVTITMP